MGTSSLFVELNNINILQRFETFNFAFLMTKFTITSQKIHYTQHWVLYKELRSSTLQYVIAK